MTKEEKIVKAGEARAKIKKEHGTGSIMTLSDKAENIEVISTGSIGLDLALGIGGLPRGRIVESYGQESCLEANTFIPYHVYDQKGKLINHKGGNIRRLYERFHGKDEGSKKEGRHLQNKNVDFYVKSVNTEGCIIRNKVLDVVKTGIKSCLLLQTKDGQSILATKEHKFMTPDGFLPLEKLSIGDTLYIHNNTRNIGRQKSLNRPDVMVKYHPKLPIKIVDNKYTYYRGQVSRMTYEAWLNGVSYEEYIDLLNTSSKDVIDKYNFLPNNTHVHHRDENFKNNKIENLEVISPSEHGMLHAKDRIKNLSFIVSTTEIVSIDEIGDFETYDIKCAYPYNNYIANGLVVHNSGKTTLAIHVIAEAQKKGGICAVVDAEQAFDKAYAKALGVDVDNLDISQPESGEEGLSIVDTLVCSGAYDVIVVDSVAALVPQRELDGEYGDSNMGLHAKLMSQAMRKLTASVRKSNTLLIFINQLRQKMVLMGNPDVTTGGIALKFYASVRLEVVRSITTENSVFGDDKQKIGNQCTVKVIKNKLAPPFLTAKFDILYGKGIDKVGEIIDFGNRTKILRKWGADVTYEGTKYKYEDFVNLINDNEEFKDKLINNIKEAISSGSQL